MILGIGINVYPPRKGFPKELRETAGAVFKEQISDGKNRLAGEFLNSFMNFYRDQGEADYREGYKRRSMVLGKEIQVLAPSGVRKARALDIDQDCRLLVEYEDRSREWLTAGEIRVCI